MHQHYLLTGFLLGTTLSSFAQSPTLAGPPAKLLAADGSPALVTFGAAGTRYGAAEAPRALREQLALAQDEQLVRTKVETDALGFTHEKYQQYYRGIKVEHAVYSVHARGGTLESLSGTVRHPGQLSVVPKLSAAAALARALAFVGAKDYMWQVPQEEAGLRQQQNNPAATYKPQGELVVVAEEASRESKQPRLVLAWKFDIYAHEPVSRAYLYVDAQTGAVVLQDAIMKHLSAPFATKYSGVRTIETEANPGGGYRLRDLSRGSGVITLNYQRNIYASLAIDFVDNDNSWTAAEYDNANADNAAGDAQFGAAAAFDYWRNVHGRTSWDNAGGQIRSCVHYGQVLDNARWDGTQMLLGDGAPNKSKPWTSLDIVSHEMAHGVCQTTANLVYKGESAALNEGFSDIWGACVEQYTADALGLTKSTWLIGEEIVLNKPALRSMSDPKSLGQPAYYQGQNWYAGGEDSDGAHINNGVLNHWFYLLSVGKSGVNEVGNSYSVTGIGITAAARIAYRAEAVYLTPNSTYADTRTFTIRAAQDLFGTCSVELAAVTNAWFAVGVGARAPLVYIASGPTQVCGGETASYTANTANATWSASPASLFSTTSGAGTYFSTSTPAGARGTGTITLTSCGQTDTRTVKVGYPEPSGYYSTGASPSYGSGVALGTYQFLGITNPQGADVGMFLTGTPYNFQFTADMAGFYFTNTTGTATHFILKPGQGVTITATSTDASCPITGRYAFVARSGGYSYSYSYAPNPASDELTVAATDPAGLAAAPFEAELFDGYGRKVKTRRSGQGKAVLDVRSLPNGLYNLRVGTGKDAYSEHIQIAH